MIELSAWPQIADDEKAAVQDVLSSNRLNYWTGTKCREFEEEWSALHDGQRALCLANGSLTLDAALRALGIGPGDEVIVSPRSYVASAMCVVMSGAIPVFADVDATSGCLTAETVEAVRSEKTKAIIPVHISGWPCNMDEMMSWADTFGISVVEDCAQAHGGSWNGRPLGTFGDIGSWSFCQDKIMTTGGEGGMLCVRDEALWKRIWSIMNHGKDYDKSTSPRSHDEPKGFRWTIKNCGTNMRMTEMQAAIGLCQLQKLDQWSNIRHRNSLILAKSLSEITELYVPEIPAGHACYRCVAYTTGSQASQVRDHLLDTLQEQGIPAMQGACPEIYKEELFELRQFNPAAMNHGQLDHDGRLPVARRLGETSLTFFCHHTIDEHTMHEYASCVSDCIKHMLATS